MVVAASNTCPEIAENGDLVPGGFVSSDGYVCSATDTNVCPCAGSVSIDNAKECQAAANAIDYSWGGNDNMGSFPKGCVFDTRTRNAFFNNHATGAAFSYGIKICAGACTPVCICV